MDDLKTIFDSFNAGGVVGLGALLAYIANWVRKLAPKYLALLEAKIARAVLKADNPGATTIEAQVIGAIRTLRALYVKRHGPLDLLNNKQRAAMIQTVLATLHEAFPEADNAILNSLIVHAGLKRKDDAPPTG